MRSRATGAPCAVLNWLIKADARWVEWISCNAGGTHGAKSQACFIVMRISALWEV
jgi:hypothetical protein